MLKEDLVNIEKIINDVKKEHNIDFIYECLIKFVQDNERFPLENSDDVEESKLAEEFRKKGSKFNKVQIKNIKELQQKYRFNTLRRLKK